MTNVSTGPMAFVERQLEALSPRDRKLLVGMYGFFGVVVVVVLWWTLHGLLDDQASRVLSAKTSLQSAQMLEERYNAAVAEVQRQETRLAQYQDQRVSAFLEGLATTRGIDLRSVNEISTEVVGGLTQSRHKVEFRRVPYGDAFGFLYELETSGFPAQIEVAEFKTTKTKDGKLLDMTLDMVVYGLAEG